MEKSNPTAYLRRVIASEYHDGAMAGIGERATDGAIVWFRVVAWDDEQWVRLFAVATIDPLLEARLVQNLEKFELRKMPFWLPGSETDTPDVKRAWVDIENAALRSDRWTLVEAHDVDEDSTEHPVEPADIFALLEVIRAASVLELRGPLLMDRFLEHARSRTK